MGHIQGYPPAARGRNWSSPSLVGVAGLSVLSVCLAANAAISGDVELLRMVAIQHDANREGIVTWQGAATIYEKILGSDSKTREIQSVASFVYDRTLDATRWNWTVNNDTLAEKEEGVYSLPVISNGMTKGPAYYAFGLVSPEKDKRPYFLRIFPRADSTKAMHGYALDPMWYLSRAGEDIATRLNWIHKHADQWSIWEVKRNGDSVIVEYDDGEVLNRYEFDMSKGGNLTSFLATEPGRRGQWQYDYVQTDGIWIPQGVVRTKHRISDGVMVEVQRREVQWTENRINEPVDPSEFALAKLGVRPGDIVTDRRLGIEYGYMGTIYGGEDELPEKLFDESPGGSDASIPPPVAPRDPSNVTDSPRLDTHPHEHRESAVKVSDEDHSDIHWYLLVALGVLMLGIAAVVLLRKRIRRQTS